MIKRIQGLKSGINLAMIHGVLTWIYIIDDMIRGNGTKFPVLFYLCASGLILLGMIALWRLSVLEKQIRAAREVLAESKEEEVL